MCYQASPSNPSSDTFTLCSWNVNRLSENDPKKFEVVVDTIRSLDCDVIALQEVSSLTAAENLAKCLSTPTDEWSKEDYDVPVHGVDEYSVFLWRKSSSIKIIKPHPPLYDKVFYRKASCLSFEYNGKLINVINVHFIARKSRNVGDDFSQKEKNDEEQDHLYDIFEKESKGAYAFIAVGDFNCYPMSFSHQGEMMTNYCQLLYPRMYTNTMEDDCYDNVLVSPDVKEKHILLPASVCDIKGDHISDHKPIKVIFSNM